MQNNLKFLCTPAAEICGMGTVAVASIPFFIETIGLHCRGVHCAPAGIDGANGIRALSASLRSAALPKGEPRSVAVKFFSLPKGPISEGAVCAADWGSWLTELPQSRLAPCQLSHGGSLFSIRQAFLFVLGSPFERLFSAVERCRVSDRVGNKLARSA